MPVPPGYQTIIRIVTSPSATALNSEISTQNDAGYTMGDLRFTDDLGTAILMFTKATGYTPLAQKVNEVNVDQTDINDDVAAEALDHNWPTGIFLYGDLSVFIAYTKLTDGGGE